MSIEVIKEDTKAMREQEKRRHELSSDVKVYKMVNGKKKLIRTDPPVPKGFHQTREKFWKSTDGK